MKTSSPARPPLNLLITGAAGFLGQHVVTRALTAGHHVRALIRPATAADALPFADHPNCQLCRADLRAAGSLDPALDGIDTVIHLAAAKTGDLYAQLASTVLGTENLLDAMHRTDVTRFVLISSFSVYDYLHRWTFARLDESSPLESHPQNRDEYCQTKLFQEQFVRQRAQKDHLQLTVLRPGVIFGKDNLWNARLGMDLSPTLWIRTGAWAKLPLTYVENCAHAIVLAAESPAAIGQTFNILDDKPPTQRHYVRIMRTNLTPRPRVIPVPWTAMRALSRGIDLVNRLVFHGHAKVPGIFVPASLHARTRPLRYANDHIKTVLHWRQPFTFEQALDRIFTRESASAAPRPRAELQAAP